MAIPNGKQLLEEYQSSTQDDIYITVATDATPFKPTANSFIGALTLYNIGAYGGVDTRGTIQTDALRLVPSAESQRAGINNFDGIKLRNKGVTVSLIAFNPEYVKSKNFSILDKG